MKTDRQLAKYLANLGYGSRKEMEAAIQSGRVTGSGDNLRFDDEPLDPAPGMVLMMNKPAGFTCSRADQGRLVYPRHQGRGRRPRQRHVVQVLLLTR